MDFEDSRRFAGDADKMVTGRSRPRDRFLVERDEVAQALDAEGSERQDFLAFQAVDLEDAVLGFHVEADLVQQILVLTEHFGNAGDGEDGADRGHFRRLVPGAARWSPVPGQEFVQAADQMVADAVELIHPQTRWRLVWRAAGMLT
jgi:hypothetical protein